MSLGVEASVERWSRVGDACDACGARANVRIVSRAAKPVQCQLDGLTQARPGNKSRNTPKRNLGRVFHAAAAITKSPRHFAVGEVPQVQDPEYCMRFEALRGRPSGVELE